MPSGQALRLEPYRGKYPCVITVRSGACSRRSCAYSVCSSYHRAGHSSKTGPASDGHATGQGVSTETELKLPALVARDKRSPRRHRNPCQPPGSCPQPNRLGRQGFPHTAVHQKRTLPCRRARRRAIGQGALDASSLPKQIPDQAQGRSKLLRAHAHRPVTPTAGAFTYAGLPVRSGGAAASRTWTGRLFGPHRQRPFYSRQHGLGASHHTLQRPLCFMPWGSQRQGWAEPRSGAPPPEIPWGISLTVPAL